MGSGSDKASKQAAKAEQERQLAMTAGTNRVNAVFDSPDRASQHQDFLKAVREHYLTDINRQKTVNDRRLKFSTARSGLTGGSADVDSRRTLGEDYQTGVLNAENRAQGALSDLQGQDEQSRLNLLSMIRAGLDSTTAAARAGSAMRVNAQGAQATSMADGLGDMFGNTASIYKTQQEGAERRRGARDAGASLYGKPGVS